MATGGLGGNLPGPLFQGFSGCVARGPRGTRIKQAARTSLVEPLCWTVTRLALFNVQVVAAALQLLRSGLIFFSNSSTEVSPLIFSPLMKKVGVESTLRISLAYFWSAAILSSSAWSFRQASTCCCVRPACLPI